MNESCNGNFWVLVAGRNLGYALEIWCTARRQLSTARWHPVCSKMGGFWMHDGVGWVVGLMLD